MDINHLLNIFVLLSCAIHIAIYLKMRIKKESAEKFYGWLAVNTFIMVFTIIAIFQLPGVSGFWGFGVWFILIGFPNLGNKLANRYNFNEQYEKALSVSRFIAFFHPMDNFRDLPDFFRILIWLRDGELEKTAPYLEEYANSPKQIKRLSYAFILTRSGRFNELIHWVREVFGEENLARSPELLPRYMEALGETGQHEEMIRLYLDHKEKVSKPYFNIYLPVLRLFMSAFCGEQEMLEKLLQGKMASLKDDQKQLWRATAMMTAGEMEKAREEFKQLLDCQSYPTRYRAQLRLSDLAPIPAPGIKEKVQSLLNQEKQTIQEEKKYHVLQAGKQDKKQAKGTYILIGIISFVFVLQIWQGGAENPLALYRTGAIIKSPDFPLQWWRFFTANFVHYGYLHLLLNLYCLHLLGPKLEKQLGLSRFYTIYVLSGMGALYFDVLLNTHPVYILMGASGSIMGLLGGTAFLLFYGFKKYKSKIAKKGLITIILILSAQFVFDALTPNVSMTAHLSGFMLGVLLTAILHRPRETEKARVSKTG